MIEQLEKNMTELEQKMAEINEKLDELEKVIPAVVALAMSVHEELEEQKKRYDMLGETNTALVSALKMLSKE